jgi:hypothetical protein
MKVLTGLTTPSLELLALAGANLIVIGRLRLEAVYADTEDGIGMGAVQPHVRFCGPAEVFWIQTVVHYAEVFVGPPGLLLVQVIMAQSSRADSSTGPFVI